MTSPASEAIAPHLSPNQQDRLVQTLAQLRPGQRELAHWTGGTLAVTAVPGAGKSHGLAVAAAVAIARFRLNHHRQLLVVTYTRSAAAHIKQKIKLQLQALDLPAVGFQVQTLHGLALAIASRHPDISQLNLEQDRFLDFNPNHPLMGSVVEGWIEAEPALYETLLAGNHFDGEETERLRRRSVLRTELLPKLAYQIIKEAKSSGMGPEQLHRWCDSGPGEHTWGLRIGAGLYSIYEKLLRSHHYLDYEDMILGALRVVEHPQAGELWRHQIFGVFEDEAQDSSPLQGRLITQLAQDPEEPSREPNLVRVGDPNQAINGTFTPADPLYFQRFCGHCDRQGHLATMDQAGRSTAIIMEAANHTLAWVNQQWQRKYNDQSLPFRFQAIAPVGPNDPQIGANPEPIGPGLMVRHPETLATEIQLLHQEITAQFQANPQGSAAILVAQNRQGRFLYGQLQDLKNQGIKVYEVNEGRRYSQIPQEMLTCVKFLQRPHSPQNLKGMLAVLQKRAKIATQDLHHLATQPEGFLYPSPLQTPPQGEAARARELCHQFLQARYQLPHYQLISFLALGLNYTGGELATAHKLAESLNQDLRGHNSLVQLVDRLQGVVDEAVFSGIEEEDESLYTRPGQLTIITMHKAKGLDWDWVFLPFLTRNVLPGQPWVPRSEQFIGDFSVPDVVRQQLRHGLHHQGRSPTPPMVSVETAWADYQREQEAEAYRLFYVAMTRAKRLLWVAAEQNGPFSWSQVQSDRPMDLIKVQAQAPSPVFTFLQRRFP